MKKAMPAGRQAFTLVEITVYAAVLAIMMGTILPTALNVVQSGQRSMVMQEVSANGRNILDQIKYKVRNASGISSVSANTLVLTNYTGSNTTITLSSGNVTINEGAGAVNLNSNDVTVSVLTFTNNTSTGVTENISVSLTVQSNFTTSGRLDYANSVTLQTSAEIRGV
jgi:type II secretory pathway pseudopilin PulG